jgi:nudix-type nucleoside diphosphatase (YffH/AdpP family)
VDHRGTGGTTDHVRIRDVDTVVDDWYALHRYTFDYRRRDGTSMRLATYVCGRGDRAAILPYHRARGTVLLTRQFRLPVLVTGHSDGVILEAAGGLLDDQSPEDAVRRELEEEIGLRVHHVDEVLVTFLNPVLLAERVHLFVADLDDAERVGSGGGVDSEGEDIETVELLFYEALSLIQRHQIVDAKTILLLYYLQSARVFHDSAHIHDSY